MPSTSMFYYVYILESINKKSTYVGYTTDLNKRLHQHNAKKHGPWTLAYVVVGTTKMAYIDTRGDAMSIEATFKYTCRRESRGNRSPLAHRLLAEKLGLVVERY